MPGPCTGFPSIVGLLAGCESGTPLVVKTINEVTHRGCGDTRPARREEGEYREYLTDEQRSRLGWIGIRMPSYLWF